MVNEIAVRTDDNGFEAFDGSVIAGLYGDVFVFSSRKERSDTPRILAR